MKKALFTVIACALAAMPVGARGLKAEPQLDHNLWWQAPEIPVVKVMLTDTLGKGTKSVVTLRVTADTDEALDIFKLQEYVNIAKGDSAEVAFTVPIAKPGFYKCVVEDEGNPIRRFNIGYEPTMVYSLPDANADFDAFWAEALAELATVPGDYTLTLDTEKSGKLRDAYAVSMKSLGGETIKGYLYMPKADGKYPVQIYYNGYGGKAWPFDVDGRPDWIEYVSSVRGQMYSEPYNTYGDWIQYRIDSPKDYYYRGAFMDVVRVIDFVEQLEKADPEHIYAEGGSQGGALTLVAASLDNRLRAVAPYIPFLTDYEDYFQIVPWPASAVFNAQKTYGLTDEELYDNLSYFDVKNFVRRISCPVMMGIGLQDPTCPPHTNMASYNLIESPKELIIYPTCGHTVDYSDWNPRRDKFFEKNQ